MQTFRSKELQKQASAIQAAAIIEPVIITDDDRPSFVLMTIQEYDRLRGRHRKSEAVVELPPALVDQIQFLGAE